MRVERGTFATHSLWRELTPLALAGVLLACFGAAALASEQRLFGSFGDSEQLIWQTKNLLAMLRTGDALIRDSFFGIVVPYAYMPGSFGEAAAIALLRGITGNVWFAYNFALFLGFVANFVSMYCCLRIGGASARAAGIGAWIFLLAPQTMAQAIAGHMWFAWTFLIPPFLLMVARAGRAAPRRWWVTTAIVTSAFVWIHEYLWLFATAVTVIAALVTLARQRSVPWKRLGLGLAAAVLIGAPFVVTQFHRLAFDRAHPAVGPRPLAANLSSNASHYVLPSNTSVLYLDLPSPMTRDFEWETLNYLGLIPLMAAAAALFPTVQARMDPTLKKLLVRSSPVAAAAIILSFGPNLGFGDPAANPIGVLYTKGIFPFTEVSAWGRFGIFTFAWFAILAAAVIDIVLRSVPRLWTSALLVIVALVVVVDQYPYFDVLDHRAPAPQTMIAAIKASPPSTRVLHVPLDPAGNARYNAMAQFLQTFHGRPIVNGYMSVIRPRYFKELTDDPIGCLQTLQVVSGPCPGTRAIADSILASDIGWVVLDRFQVETTVFSAENPFRVALRMEAMARIMKELERRGVIAREYSDSDYELFRVMR